MNRSVVWTTLDGSRLQALAYDESGGIAIVTATALDSIDANTGNSRWSQPGSWELPAIDRWSNVIATTRATTGNGVAKVDAQGSTVWQASIAAAQGPGPAITLQSITVAPSGDIAVSGLAHVVNPYQPPATSIVVVDGVGTSKALDVSPSFIVGFHP